MSGTYKVIGINLKAIPMGESDRLLTILTKEQGLMKAIAMGSRKQNSHLGGRSGLFVINHLLIAKGRSLDKITQAETIESFAGLSQDLRKLTASQYLAELVLFQALSDQPQEDLFLLFTNQLQALSQAKAEEVLPLLTRGSFQLLALAGIAPQLHSCCVTQAKILPDFETKNWRVGFSVPAGGVCTLAALEQIQPSKKPRPRRFSQPQVGDRGRQSGQAQLTFELTAPQLYALQQLPQVELPIGENSPNLMQNFSHKPTTLEDSWLSTERVLRQYAQYHFDRIIRSAALIDACFESLLLMSP